MPNHDPRYLAWLAEWPCLVSGLRPVTIHHVRRFGEPRIDRRTVPLIAALHLIQHGPEYSVEAMGRRGFQEFFQVDFEAAIADYNRAYNRTFPSGSVF